VEYEDNLNQTWGVIVWHRLFVLKYYVAWELGGFASLTFIKSHYPMINQSRRRLSQASRARRVSGTSQTET
jgi:hypothetical protein